MVTTVETGRLMRAGHLEITGIKRVDEKTLVLSFDSPMDGEISAGSITISQARADDLGLTD